MKKLCSICGTFLPCPFSEIDKKERKRMLHFMFNLLADTRRLASMLEMHVMYDVVDSNRRKKKSS